jgi:hypothetical protein
MGLLQEYHAMPFLRDVAHDGVLCTFSKRSSPGQVVWSVGAGGMDRQSHTKSHPAGHFLLQLARPPCWASPLAFFSA